MATMVEDKGEETFGTYPGEAWLYRNAYHWLHSERSSTASIAQWMSGHGAWYLIGEKDAISPGDLHRRGWEYLGPCNQRPTSQHLDG